MNEAPKKIWLADYQLRDVATWEWDEGTPYIRADIVDELVAALKYCMRYNGYDFDEGPAEAALKKLEDV